MTITTSSSVSKSVTIIAFKVCVKYSKSLLSYEAEVKISVDGKIKHTVSEGNSDVDALYKAMCKALGKETNFVLDNILINSARQDLLEFIKGVCL